ncbi:hypothetical protein psal_cds_1233 [Pandoravirus salinus]|uniref:Uncharacterized protein n=1 Tax=Pandoravirus salinus TaxID=1349410 RepID=S4W5D5_9VIRU|nr:hypothetical protein psal_cds_1233 [Pandoravirus salinus]AGO85555.1 hypothetical protein psal_cds_1233 [Pandoravirus salinus]
MHMGRTQRGLVLFLGLLATAAAVTSTVVGPTPSPHLEGACEMVLDGVTCRQRCACEWCPPGPDHGCHAVNLAGACGGEPGQRAPHDACYDDPASGVEGLVVGGVFVGLALAVVGLWWVCRCVRSVRCPLLRRNDYESARSADESGTGADLGGVVNVVVDTASGPTIQADGPLAGPPRRPASRPIDMPRPRKPIP